MVRHCGHHGGPCAGVRGGGGSGAASTADARLPIRGRAEKGWDEGREIGCNGLVKA